MSVSITTDSPAISLAELPVTHRERKLVVLAAILLIVAFAISAPFASKPLVRLDGFIPTIEGMIFVNDLITSILLFAQYSTAPSRSLLMLACGYLFTAFIIVPHVLAFPGAITPTGILYAGLQTSPWLYYFWHIGFPIWVIAYAYACRIPDRGSQNATISKIIWSATGVFALVCVLTLLATAGKQLLPPILTSDIHTIQLNLILINSLNILVVVVSLVVVWTRRSSVLDYWLMLVLLASLSELVLSNTLNDARFSLGYYVGRAFSLATSVFVLGLLLSEMTRLYTRLARTNALLARERDNKLMNIEAVTAVIAHEIAQPLAAIAANGDAALELLNGLPADTKQVSDALSDIVEDSHRTVGVIDGMRTLFRNTDQSKHFIDMNTLALEVLGSLRGELDEHGIIARPELSDIPHIQGNRSQLHQVIFNLTHNAIEAMAITTNRRLLSLTTEAHGPDAIVIAVKDTGPGIAPQRLDGIFDAFVTTKSHGTGLGLAICRLIVERHGGQLSAWSDGKSGALFQIVLPVEAAGGLSGSA